MSLMKFIDVPDTAVHAAFCGLKYAYPSLIVDPENRIVLSNQIVKNQVCLLSGGGSGHEPFAAGFVGAGMLSGAVGGYIFASPPVQAIYNAICNLAERNNNAGVLVVVLNYTGDILTFGLASEKAKTRNIRVEILIVDEDCSRTDDEVQDAGRRGMCGCCFIYKIAGSMAAEGKSLTEIASECRIAIPLMATLGVAVSPCTVPGTGPLFTINSDEIDIGLGVHGEAGILRTKMKPVDEIVEIMISKLTEALNLTCGSKICALLNNAGSVSQLEMGVLCNKICSTLGRRNIEILRVYNGSFMTSLDMAGFQICIFNVTNHLPWLQYVDAPTEAPAWNGTRLSIPPSDSKSIISIKEIEDDVTIDAGPQFTTNEAIIFEKCLLNISEYLTRAEKKLNELDTSTGDGDCGSTLKRLAEGITKSIPEMKLQYPASCFYKLSKLSQNTMGGSSGGLYGILLTGAAKCLRSSKSLDWAVVWKASIGTLQQYSTAKIGDRTMIDALVPACEEFSRRVANNSDKIREALAAACAVAESKCEETKFMKARLGRASYVPSEYIKDVDPGAHAVTVWLKAILDTLRSAAWD